MKNRILSFILLTGLAFSLPGCQDFLVETNPNQISTDSFWKNLDDADAGLVAVYNAFKNGNIMRTGDEYNRSDLTWPGWGVQIQQMPITCKPLQVHRIHQTQNGMLCIKVSSVQIRLSKQ